MALTLLLLGAVVANMCSAQAVEPPTDEELSAWLDKQIESVLPKSEEKKFDEIGWAKDIREALQLAKQHSRPVFLFTHDGQMDTGRC